jgi:hypothetical protein
MWADRVASATETPVGDRSGYPDGGLWLFAAGAPLVSASGCVPGVLGIIDDLARLHGQASAHGFPSAWRCD